MTRFGAEPINGAGLQSFEGGSLDTISGLKFREVQIKLTQSRQEIGAQNQQEKKGKNTRSFAGLLLQLVFPTPFMCLSQVNLREKLS